MAQFVGDFDAFNKYLGPFVRNRVNQITRQHRNMRNGICEHCGKKSVLDAAHVHGRERVQIMREATQPFMNEAGVICGHVDKIMKSIEEKHMPIEETFKFLCRTCHQEYDEYNLHDDRNGGNGGPDKVPPTDPPPPDNPPTEPPAGKSVRICGVDFHLPREEGGVFQKDIRRLLEDLFGRGFLSDEEVKKLYQLEYSKKMLGIQFPLFSPVHKLRYWRKPINGHYVCSEWWKQHFSRYNQCIHKWLLHLKDINESKDD